MADQNLSSIVGLTSVIKSIQRGSSSAQNISTTVSEVDINKSILNVQASSGFRASGGSGGGVSGAYLLNATTVVSFQGPIEGNSGITYGTVHWELIEYV